MIRITGKEWLYLAVALTGGIIGGAFSSRVHVGAALAIEAPPKKIAAQEIVLVDAAGGERAILHLNDDAQPVFEMMDHAGKPRVAIGFVGSDQTAFRMADRNGALRIALSINEDQMPALRLYDSQSRARTLLGVDSDGEPALDFYESSGKLLRELP
jgi:hypothetical protein